ncbi:hypothetical protein TGAM01_v204999 [Trichoderma gamsii]|uniref:Uncharacterized protein n=1 Tax=Trichoderma gamsii TaxID=398673 RepID=A0A2P4ZP35_9HYPO|nr:hypothetical protein TGAM01_v204999 [Trichoderma gamsii]PON26055.1 hypothetical protein TGAM01_v204999 [Trichoderma gamsii]
MRGYYQSKTPIEVGMWLFVEKNRQPINDSVKRELLARNGIPNAPSPIASIDNNTVQIGTQHTQENQDAVGQSPENAGGNGVRPDLAAQMSRLQLHRPIDFRQDSMSSRAYPSRTVIGFETLPVSYPLLENVICFGTHYIQMPLRASPYNDRLAYCSPVLTWSDTSNCSISFLVEEIPQQTIPNNGQCWHRMFKNATIVKRIPIRRKSVARVGLEIPLNIMAGLARTRRMEEFNGKCFLKGFSAMLAPTKRSGDTIIWHYVYKEDGSYISFLDNSGGLEHVNNVDVETSRHVVGRCMEAKIYAGSSKAEPVSCSHLPKPQADDLFSNISVSLGRYVVGGSPYMLGAKDTPIHISEDGYIPRLKWISRKFVLLWDEANKRGWLVNGTTALLHLVRASLNHDSKDEFKPAFLFKRKLICYDLTSLGRNGSTYLGRTTERSDERQRSIAYEERWATALPMK